MSAINTPSLVNPNYEVGIYYPINEENKEITTKINLPIPRNVIFFREFKAGETLPITFKATGDLIALDSTPQKLTILQDIFVKMTKKDVSFSLDQKQWKPFQDIFRGSVTTKVEQREDGDPHAMIHLVANALKNDISTLSTCVKSPKVD